MVPILWYSTSVSLSLMMLSSACIFCACLLISQVIVFNSFRHSRSLVSQNKFGILSKKDILWEIYFVRSSIFPMSRYRITYKIYTYKYQVKLLIFLKRFICLVEVNNNTVNYTQTIKMFMLVKFSSPTR